MGTLLEVLGAFALLCVLVGALQGIGLAWLMLAVIGLVGVVAHVRR